MKKLFVVTGPSGAGLGDIIRGVFAAREDVSAVTPVTARKMKEGEENGIGFWFYDLEEWNALKESGDLLEATEVAGNDYGTLRSLVREQLSAGKNVLLNREPERAAQVKKNMPEAVCVWIEPSDPEQLRARYAESARSTFETQVRMALAAEQRKLADFCDFRIEDDDVKSAVKEMCMLIERLSD